MPFHHVPVSAATKAEAEQQQLTLLREYDVDLLVLARYMQVLLADFVAHYGQRIINVHHSFLPAFSGARPYQWAWERGVKLIGATSHYVTAMLDDGPIIEQDVVRVSHCDQLDDIVQKGRDLEQVVLSRAVRWHAERRGHGRRMHHIQQHHQQNDGDHRYAAGNVSRTKEHHDSAPKHCRQHV